MGKMRHADYQGVMHNWHGKLLGMATAIWERQAK